MRGAARCMEMRGFWPAILVNGKEVSGDVETRTLLVDFLRNQQRLTGVKEFQTPFFTIHECI